MQDIVILFKMYERLMVCLSQMEYLLIRMTNSRPIL
jgi:hypothetical protein